MAEQYLVVSSKLAAFPEGAIVTAEDLVKAGVNPVARVRSGHLRQVEAQAKVAKKKTTEPEKE